MKEILRKKIVEDKGGKPRYIILFNIKDDEYVIKYICEFMNETKISEPIIFSELYHNELEIFESRIPVHYWYRRSVAAWNILRNTGNS